jgi:hypothetical protein
MSGYWQPFRQEDEVEPPESTEAAESLESAPDDDSETDAKGHDSRFRRRID